MKILFVIFLFSVTGIASYAQSFGIINDKDGYVNVRKEKSTNSAVVGKIYNDSLFGYDDEDKSDWIKIYKEDSGNSALEGYVHKSRIRPISKFRRVKNIRLYNDSCIAVDDNLTIVIKSRLFNVKKHELTYDKTYPKELIKIDGRHVWGTDGEIPKKVISSVKFIKNGRQIIIPADAFTDLYEPSFRSFKVYEGDDDTVYIEMDNSDGAGAYTVIWIIKNNQYLKRYLDDSNV